MAIATESAHSSNSKNAYGTENFYGLDTAVVFGS